MYLLINTLLFFTTGACIMVVTCGERSYIRPFSLSVSNSVEGIYYLESKKNDLFVCISLHFVVSKTYPWRKILKIKFIKDSNIFIYRCTYKKYKGSGSTFFLGWIPLNKINKVCISTLFVLSTVKKTNNWQFHSR